LKDSHQLITTQFQINNASVIAPPTDLYHKRSNYVILSYIKLRPTECEIVLLLTLREESDGFITMSLQQWLSDHGLSGCSQALTD
jgi:hypothetical protein